MPEKCNLIVLSLARAALGILFALSAFAASIDGVDFNSLQLQKNCQIYSLSGEALQIVPGDLCLFLDDGSFVSSTDRYLRFFSKNDEVIWEHSGHFHHQMNFSQDRKRILALSSAFDGTIRQDRFLILDLTGKVLHSQTTDSLLHQANLPALKNFFSIPSWKSERETSHFNSIYEIPPTQGLDLPSYLKEGNVIVNSLDLGFFILSPDLQTVLYHARFPNSYEHRVHDVQVTPEGNFIYFNNNVNFGQKTNFIISGPEVGNFYSGVYEVKPQTFEIVRWFESNPKEMFYSWVSSNVQRLSRDIWLFTHHLDGVYIYSHATKSMIHALPALHFWQRAPLPLHEIRAGDFRRFLDNRNKKY